MQPIFAYSASALAGLWLIVHFVIGGREVAGPLRRNIQLPEVVRVTAWMCWHMVTACIGLLALLPLLALALQMQGLMVAAMLLAAVLSIAGIASQLILKTGLKLLPQGWLFVPIVVLAGLAL